MIRPVKIRYEDNCYFMVIPKEAFRQTGLKVGDWVMVTPFKGFFIAKKIQEEGHGVRGGDTA